MTRSAYLVILSSVACALSACDDWFFRHVEVAGPDTAGFALDSPSTEAVLATVREYAAQANLRCPSVNELPFECSRTPIRVRVQPSEHGLVVCYFAHGATFERGKFERRMDQLQGLLSERFGSQSVMTVPYDCPRNTTTTPNGTRTLSEGQHRAARSTGLGADRQG